MRLVPYLALAAVAAGAAGSSGRPAPAFVERAAEAGLGHVTWSGGPDKNHILESTGNGVLVVDYDGDGWQDLYFVAAYRLPRADGAERGALYRNLGDGRFEDVSDRAGVGAHGVYGHGGAVGDADGDGLPDLYVTAFGRNLLFRNNGDGTFSELGVRAGVADPGWSLGAVFFDADGDGDDDLYVANYIEATWDEILAARRTRRWRGKVNVMDGPRGLPVAANTFYRNRGDGTFDDATASAGLRPEAEGYSMGVVAFDAELDGDLDLYVANDSTPNHLFRNRGDGTFEETGAWMGCAYGAHGDAQGSMGVAVGDPDGDGWPDLVVTNFAHDAYTYYRSLDGRLFLDDSVGVGLAVATFAPLGWGVLFLDADLDGDEDLFLANGHIYPQVDLDPTLHESFRQPDQLLINEGGRFRDASAAGGLGAAPVRSSRGAASLDLDRDGDVDVVVSNQDERPSLLENRTPSGGRWLVLEPVAAGGATALARARVVAGGAAVHRFGHAGGSYASASEAGFHFGLGDAAEIDQVELHWRGGGQTVLRRLPPDRRVRVFGRRSP